MQAVAAGDFAPDPGPSSRGREAVRLGDGAALRDPGDGRRRQFLSADARVHSHPSPASQRSLRPRPALFAVLHRAAADLARRRPGGAGGGVSAACRDDPHAAVASDGLTAIAIDGKTLRGSFDAFYDRKAAHMMSALRQADRIVLAHMMVAEKSNEIPAAPELIEALGLKDCLFTLDAEHCQKNCSRAS